MVGKERVILDYQHLKELVRNIDHTDKTEVGVSDAIASIRGTLMEIIDELEVLAQGK